MLLFLAVPYFSFPDRNRKRIKAALMSASVCMTQQRCRLILRLEVGHILAFFLPRNVVLLLGVIDTRVPPLKAFTIISLISMEFNSSADEYLSCFANKFHTFRPWSVSLAGFFRAGLSWPSPAYFTGSSVCSSCLYSAWNLISFGLPVPSGSGKDFSFFEHLFFFRLLLRHCRIL